MPSSSSSHVFVFLVYRAFLLITSRLLRGVWARAVPLSNDYDNDHHYDNNNSGISQVRGPRSAFIMILEGSWVQWFHNLYLPNLYSIYYRQFLFDLRVDYLCSHRKFMTLITHHIIHLFFNTLFYFSPSFLLYCQYVTIWSDEVTSSIREPLECLLSVLEEVCPVCLRETEPFDKVNIEKL